MSILIKKNIKKKIKKELVVFQLSNAFSYSFPEQLSITKSLISQPYIQISSLTS